MFKNATGILLSEREVAYQEYLKNKNFIIKKGNKLYLFNEEVDSFINIGSNKDVYQIFKTKNFQSLVIILEEPIQESYNSFKNYLFSKIPNSNIKNDSNNYLNSMNPNKEVKIFKNVRMILINEDLYENSIIIELLNKYKINELKLNYKIYLNEVSNLLNIEKSKINDLLQNLNIDINLSAIKYFIKNNVEDIKIFDNIKELNYFFYPSKLEESFLKKTKDDCIIISNKNQFKKKILNINEFKNINELINVISEI